jgi:hypothetical protein
MVSKAKTAKRESSLKLSKEYRYDFEAFTELSQRSAMAPLARAPFSSCLRNGHFTQLRLMAFDEPIRNHGERLH